MFDVLFLGGGLANLFLAERCLQRHPHAKILILDENTHFPQERTWSFHSTDLSPQAWNWVQPYLSARWIGYDLAFPQFNKSFLAGEYASLRGADLLDKLRVKKFISWREKVQSVSGNTVMTHGHSYSAKIIVDGRGPSPSPGGYQKFLGLQLRLKSPHQLTRPILMDARVPQTDGFRFFYVLPWNKQELLIEDTYYSNSKELDLARVRAEILLYAERRNWQVESILGEESSALPIPFFASPTTSENISNCFSVGMRAELFQPTTGYSTPYALELAHSWDPLAETAAADYRRFLRNRKSAHTFYHSLNRMLFLAAKPEKRIQVFQRFYQLPEPLIQRFYAGKNTRLDQTRILVGKPPVPVVPALKAIFQGREEWL
jgi:lycopene beta-cyclase